MRHSFVEHPSRSDIRRKYFSFELQTCTKGRKNEILCKYCEQCCMIAAKHPSEVTKCYTVARVLTELMFCARFWLSQVFQLFFKLCSSIEEGLLLKSASVIFVKNVRMITEAVRYSRVLWWCGEMAKVSISLQKDVSITAFC